MSTTTPNRKPRRARARGQEVTLTDGRTVRVRYGMAGLDELEDCFGSIGAVQDVLNSLDIRRPLFRPLAQLLACGLVQAGLVERDDGELPSWRQVQAVLYRDDLIDQARLQEAYLPAVVGAIDEAFPDVPPAGRGKALGVTTPSPGTPGATRPSSSSDAPTQSSGA